VLGDDDESASQALAVDDQFDDAKVVICSSINVRPRARCQALELVGTVRQIVSIWAGPDRAG